MSSPHLLIFMSYMCPVCGFPELARPPRNLLHGGASHQICPCCYFHFGYDDDARRISYEEWREDWIEAGMLWKSVGAPRPESWNPVTQLLKLDLQQYD